jgi:hypothetical protein
VSTVREKKTPKSIVEFRCVVGKATENLIFVFSKYIIKKRFLYFCPLDFVAQAVYGGQPDAPPGSVYDILFDEGVRMGSWGLLLHSITGYQFD